MGSGDTRPQRTRGKLIALEGLDDKDLLRSGKLLLQRAGGRPGGVSQWGASDLFFQLEICNCPETPSPATLLMLYAADLAFRLRWEINPLLEEGKDVVAAPYLETAVGFGKAAGLPAEWMDRLFEFAPRPNSAFRLPHGGKGAKGMPGECFRILAGASRHWKKRAGSKPIAQHLTKLKPLPRTGAGKNR